MGEGGVLGAGMYPIATVQCPACGLVCDAASPSAYGPATKVPGPGDVVCCGRCCELAEMQPDGTLLLVHVDDEQLAPDVVAFREANRYVEDDGSDEAAYERYLRAAQTRPVYERDDGRKLSCLHCGQKFKGVLPGLEVPEQRPPAPGDVSLCGACGELTIIAADGVSTEMIPAELFDDVLRRLPREVQRVRNAIMARKAKSL